ncbi:MAG: hypothetical protein M1834_002527 [Cirrosporium novae-zelandiae]|nr:MAG: hypothetical protein M1834_002527 [Cirrosporium novae-zelandiae]
MIQIAAADRANVLAILAIGATCTLHHDIHAQYLSHAGHHELAYLCSGSAVRKPLTAGLQNLVFSSGWQSNAGPDAKTTLLAVYGFEKYICFTLGKPSSFSPETLIAESDSCPVLSSVAKLTQVISEIQRFQEQKKLELNVLWESSQAFHHHLDRVAIETSGKCLLVHGENSRQLDDVSCLTVILYHYAILINYRPFLIFRVLQNTLRNSSTRNDLDPKNSTVIDNGLSLPEASQYAVHSAKMIISTLAQIFITDSLVKNLPPNAFFIETSCFTLILDGQFGNERDKHLAEIHKGLECLSRMACKSIISARIESIETALAATGLKGASISRENPTIETNSVPCVSAIEGLSNHNIPSQGNSDFSTQTYGQDHVDELLEYTNTMPFNYDAYMGMIMDDFLNN